MAADNHDTASPDMGQRAVVRREVLRFAVPALIGIIVLTLVSLAVAVAVAREQSMRDATLTAQFLARSVVQPRLSEQLVAGRPSEITALDQALETTSEGSDVVGLRVWNRDGVIIYADDPRVIGETFDLAGIAAGFEPGAPLVAGPADITRPENRYLDPDAEIVDVSVPVVGADGQPYLFQVHQLQDTIQEDARDVWWAFAPVLVGSLILVGLLLGMLALRMARRISADLAVRQGLLQRSVEAGDVERRRIAAQLHDGTVQDLAGLSYTLAGLSARSRGAGAGEQADQLDAAAAQTRDAVRGLRSLLVDIYPANLAQTGLAAALADQAAALQPRIEVEMSVADLPGLDPQVARATYRIAREALTNVAKHSAARRASVTLEQDQEGSDMVLTVTDDGRGFDPGSIRSGHVGLRISQDVAESVGGHLVVDSAPGRGATVTFRVPIR